MDDMKISNAKCLYSAIDKMIAATGKSENKVSLDVFGYNRIQSSKSRNLGFTVFNTGKLADYCGYTLALIPKDSLPEDAIPIWDDSDSD